MIDQEQATAKILGRVRALTTRVVPLADALDCFGAADLSATISLPLFDNSAMDGYAVAASSCAPGARLKIVGEQPAGIDRQLSVGSGQAVRIFTGAPLPAGADAVVMQEDVTVEGDEVLLGERVEPGEFVRRRGGDVAAGQKILARGERIHPQTIALLAAQGVGSVEVGGLARVSIISTGDELAPPGATLQPGQVYEANSALLQALTHKCGAHVVSAVHCADDSQQIERALRDAIAGSDVIIISGGVSVGDHDLVKPALTAVGAVLELWRVAVKPGKPFLFGHKDDCAIFGLPGNPISAFVTFLLFVRPALLRMMGAGDVALALPHVRGRLAQEVRNSGDRPHYLRGSLGGDGTFTPVGRQESHALYGLSRSNALLLVQPGEHIAAGAETTLFTWE